MPEAASLFAPAVGLVLTLAAVGCAAGTQVQLDAAAARGQDVAQQAGCAGCHGGLDADATVGPAWNGSWGTDITLDDGTVVRFDESFVETAVRDPDAQRREGDWLHMPAFGALQVSDAELADVVAYLRAMGDA